MTSTEPELSTGTRAAGDGGPPELASWVGALRSGPDVFLRCAKSGDQRKKLERLCRYITRPAIAEQRLSLARNGNVIVAFKTPKPEDGSEQVSQSTRDKAYSMTWAQRLKRVFAIDPNAARLRSVRSASLFSHSSQLF